jgi:predicted phage-related endonuclease
MTELPETLRADVRLLRHLDAEKSKLQTRLDELNDLAADAEERIQTFMQDEEELTQDGAPVVVWKKTTQRRLNQKKLKEKFPRIHEACKTDVEYRTFKVVQDNE